VRKEIEGRPALVLLFGFLCGLAGADSAWRWAYALGLLVLLRKPTSRGAMLAAAAVGFFLFPRVMPMLESDTMVSGVGRVVTMPRKLEAAQRLVWEFNGAQYDLISLGSDSEYAIGDSIAVSGVARPPTLENRPYFRVHQLRGRITAKTHLVRKSDILGTASALKVRSQFLTWSSAKFPDGRAQLLQSMCFGTDTLLTPTQWKQLRDSGTIHLVSASGFQVSILCTALVLLVSQIPIGRPGMLVLLGCLLWIYAIAAGFNAPVLRALIMAMVPPFAYLFRRESDFINTMALAALALLLYRPSFALEPGFQLSFLAVAGLGLFAGVQSEGTGLVQNSLGSSLVATLITLPLLLVHFGAAPIVGVLSNVLVALPSSAAVVLSLSQFCLSSLGVGFLEIVTVPLIEGLLRWCEVCISTSANVQVGRIQIDYFPADLGAAVTMLIFAQWRFKRVEAR